MGEGFLFANEPALACPPILYAMVAALVSAWQAYRGFRLQWLARERQGDLFSTVSRRERLLLFCLADAFFYSVCSGIGFAALWLAWSLLDAAISPGVGIGFGAIWIFLLLLGATGATGQLPYLIQLGKVGPGR
jgi:hypothetical protein